MQLKVREMSFGKRAIINDEISEFVDSVSDKNDKGMRKSRK